MCRSSEKKSQTSLSMVESSRWGKTSEPTIAHDFDEKTSDKCEKIKIKKKEINGLTITERLGGKNVGGNKEPVAGGALGGGEVLLETVEEEEGEVDVLGCKHGAVLGIGDVMGQGGVLLRGRVGRAEPGRTGEEVGDEVVCEDGGVSEAVVAVVRVEVCVRRAGLVQEGLDAGQSRLEGRCVG